MDRYCSCGKMLLSYEARCGACDTEAFTRDVLLPFLRRRLLRVLTARALALGPPPC